MPTDPLSTVSTRRTPQSEQADDRQVPNSAGGYTFQITPEQRLHRFLMLGVDGGTYYTSGHELAKGNAQVVLDMAESDGALLVATIVKVSVEGRAPKQNPTLFALAVAASAENPETRKLALGVLPEVCRIPTHLFTFLGYVQQFRGWGRALRRAVGNWYLDRDVEALGYAMAKYQQRGGWSHRDLLRLSHPNTDEPTRKNLFDWACGRAVDGWLPSSVVTLQKAQRAETVSEVLGVIETAERLSWEMLPSWALKDASVWKKMIEWKFVPYTALMRNLPRLTNLGLFSDMRFRNGVALRLTGSEAIERARVHPVSVLVALRTYASGRSAAGSGEWIPNRQIIDALDSAFYTAFGNVEPTGKRTLLALDVSGSMVSPVSGLPLTCREASAALALVTASVESNVDIVGFTSGSQGFSFRRSAELTELDISPRQRLNDAIQEVSNLPFGDTDCALPMTWALKNGREYDSFFVYTDSETWAGSIHPHQALVQYRQKTGIPARLAVVGMTATNFSIADPSDPGSLDVVGFDSASPQLLADFSAGRV